MSDNTLMNRDKIRIEHNEARQRFEIHFDSGHAKLMYYMQGDSIVFSHTAVPGLWREQGMAGMLVQAGLDYARLMGLKVIPLCPFVSAFIHRRPEYRDLL